jgi:hypothetical protein
VHTLCYTYACMYETWLHILLTSHNVVPLLLFLFFVYFKYITTYTKRNAVPFLFTFFTQHNMKYNSKQTSTTRVTDGGNVRHVISLGVKLYLNTYYDVMSYYNNIIRC